MSIQSEITRLAAAKSDLKTAINAKGGALANESISAYAAAVNGLQTGGCTVATAEATITKSATSISFTGLEKEPKLFCIMLNGNVNDTTGKPTILSVIGNGNNVYAVTGHLYVKSSSSYYANLTYYDTTFSCTYSGGELTVSTTKYMYFIKDIKYKLFYVY